jgi:hypothetical protein
MIVWSRGLGKMRLPIELAEARMKIEPDLLMMEGVIVPTCWNYSIKLTQNDLNSFLRLVSDKTTIQYLSQKGGVLAPFLLGLIAALPKIIFKIAISLPSRIFGRRQTKEDFA